MYGCRVTRELPKLGLAAHRNTVSPIMQECGIRAKHLRKYRPTTTQSAHAHAPSPDLLKRDFTADGPNKKWMCDITYIATDALTMAVKRKSPDRVVMSVHDWCAGPGALSSSQPQMRPSKTIFFTKTENPCARSLEIVAWSKCRRADRPCAWVESITHLRRAAWS